MNVPPTPENMTKLIEKLVEAFDRIEKLEARCAQLENRVQELGEEKEHEKEISSSDSSSSSTCYTHYGYSGSRYQHSNMCGASRSSRSR